MAKKTKDRTTPLTSPTKSQTTLTTWTKNLLNPQTSDEDESIYKLLSIVLIAPFILFIIVVLFDTDTYHSILHTHEHHDYSNNVGPMDYNIFADARSTATVSMQYSFVNKPILCNDGYTYVSFVFE